MGIYVKDNATDWAVRKLAKLKGTTLTEAIRSAVESEIGRLEPSSEDAVLASLIKQFKEMPDTGLAADKTFFDGLYED